MIYAFFYSYSDRKEFVYIEEFPLKMLHEIQSISGHVAKTILTISFEYGHETRGKHGKTKAFYIAFIIL